MANQLRKRDWLLFILAAVLALLLLLFGASLIFLDPGIFSSTFFYAAALVLIGGGILFAMPAPAKNWLPATALGVFGFYSLGRATDFIRLPWLAIVVGLFCWVGAITLLYMAHPETALRRRTQNESQNSQTAKS